MYTIGLRSGINDTSCTREIKYRMAMTTAAISTKKMLFTSKLDLNLRKKLAKCYIGA
jgi:hypothetical protein